MVPNCWAPQGPGWAWCCSVAHQMGLIGFIIEPGEWRPTTMSSKPFDLSGIQSKVSQSNFFFINKSNN